MQYAYVQGFYSLQEKKIQGLFKHHSLISQNSQTFPKLEKQKINSRTFPDFKDPWEPCIYVVDTYYNNPPWP